MRDPMNSSEDVPPGLWRHYKNVLYRVIGVANDSTNGNSEGRLMVIYISDAEHGLRVRDLNQFLEMVELPDGRKCPRFTYITPAKT